MTPRLLLPPPRPHSPARGSSGNTDFADIRAASDELPLDLNDELLANDYVATHSLFRCRKATSPEYFADVDPTQHQMHLHRVVQRHERSERMNLYIAAHAQHVGGLLKAELDELMGWLMAHAMQEKYTMRMPLRVWVIWWFGILPYDA